MDIIQIPTTQTPGAGLGDVVGPASATDNAIVRYDATTGRLLQNSTVTIADSTGAIAGASSLTSPASTNLTLATGTFGTALTVASGTGYVGIGTTTPSDNLVISNAGAAGLEIGVSTGSVITQSYNRSTSAYVNFQDNCLNRIFCTNGSTEAMRLASTGTVSIASATAGSSGAGALVVTGGLATGAASYFGGAVTVNGAGSTNYGAANPTLILNRASSAAGNFVRFQGTAAYDTYIGTIGTAAGIAPTADTFVIGSTVAGLPTFALVPSTGAATFSGAVAIANTVSSVSPTSPNRTITMVVGGVTLYIAAKTTND